MAEELRVVGAHHDRRPLHARPEPLPLAHPGVDEVLGVCDGAPVGGLGIVRLLGVGAAGDPVVLDPGVDALAARRQVRPHVVVLQVEADVPVEVAVREVARIALVRAPDLLRALRIAREDGEAVRGGDGRVGAVRRPGCRIREPVRVDDRPAEPGPQERRVDARGERAFGEPEALGVATEEAAILRGRDLDLRPHGGRLDGEQRQQPVRRRRGDDVDQPALFGDVDEFTGEDQSARWIAPAQQCFHPHYAS